MAAGSVVKITLPLWIYVCTSAAASSDEHGGEIFHGKLFLAAHIDA